MTGPTIEPLWTTEDAAGYLRRDPATLRHWRTDGTGPPYIPGRRVLYRPADVVRWADRQVRPAARPGLRPIGRRRAS